MATRQTLAESLQCTSTLKRKATKLLTDVDKGISQCSEALEDLAYLKDIYNLRETPKTKEIKGLMNRLKMLENDIVLVKTDIKALLQDLA